MKKSLFFTAPHTVEIIESAVPYPTPNQLLIKTICSGISAGTEMLMYQGLFPPDLPADSAIESLAKPLAYPFQYGYAAVGRVIECGKAVDPFWLGQRVFAFHPHESHFVATPQQLVLLPDRIPSETAVLLPNMETAVSFVMDAQPMIGEKVLVLGQGIVGLLTSGLLAQFPLEKLIAVDNYPLRRQWAERVGVDVILDPQSETFTNQLADALSSEYVGADLVLELSGNPIALNTAIEAVGFNGRILVGSWYGQKQAQLNLGGSFHRKKMQIISSQVSEIAPQWNGRWSKNRRFQQAMQNLDNPILPSLITHTFPLVQAADAYALILNQPTISLQIVLTYT